ncbi:MAG: tetrathionate reductase family octaheme c-type cytochrome [Desulfobacterales bacterium]
MLEKIKQIIPLLFTVLLMILPVVIFIQTDRPIGAEPDNPYQFVEKKAATPTHAYLFSVEKFADGPGVTKACLECHPDAGAEMLQSAHFTWLGEEVNVPGRSGKIRIGKKNLINNFCISIESNWPRCTTCHAGYGWQDETFDFQNPNLVDCLVCHDQSGGYTKAISGIPEEEVDLLASAKSVGRPTRDNCGWCHFNGGGGNAVKHGDLDGSLAKPVERIDVHMGRLDFQCITCHRTKNHQISGRMISVSARDTIGVKCTDCHASEPHRSERLNMHYQSVACQTCHIPVVATKEATKIAWDWSTAGKDVSVQDPHHYLKMKGSFLYAKKLVPEYYWFNGDAARYLKGDVIDPAKVTHINFPQGGIDDPGARIWPFKVHRAKQPYDKIYKHLLIPQTVGKGGFWSDFDWHQAILLGSQVSGLKFSGEFGFAETDMFWVLSHMVAPRQYTLQCTDCHGDSGRLNWSRLGYAGDPATVGGRQRNRMVVYPFQGRG